MKEAVTIPEITPLAPIEPAPMMETARRPIPGPKIASSRKLKNGIAGIRPVSSSTLSFHLAGAVGIEHAVLMVKPQKQRQADRDF